MIEIKLNTDELRLMSLFQSITSATARDCIVDGRMDRVIFVVNKGQMGLAIGKGGATINAEMVSDVKLSDRPDGTKQAIVTVDARKKGAVVGREGRNAEKARMLAKRYFQITNVLIVSPEQQGTGYSRVSM
jgi:N utilization substance protein A